MPGEYQRDMVKNQRDAPISDTCKMEYLEFVESQYDNFEKDYMMTPTAFMSCLPDSSM